MHSHASRAFILVSTSAARRGFTIIELLIVIGIIAVLSAIALVAGGKVLTGGKRAATQDVMRVLDTALDAYISSKGGNPPPWVETVPGNDLTLKRVFPVADVRDVANNAMVNSVGLFMLQCVDVPTTQGHLNGIPARFIASRPIRGGNNIRSIPTIIDAWGNPIRYVHPAFDGVIAVDSAVPGTGVELDSLDLPDLKTGQTRGFAPGQTVRRTYKNSDDSLPFGADGDGATCIGNRPYFYSVGEDLKTGFLTETNGTLKENRNADNVYTTIPALPNEKL